MNKGKLSARLLVMLAIVFISFGGSDTAFCIYPGTYNILNERKLNIGIFKHNIRL